MTRKIVLLAVTFAVSSLLAQGAWAQLFGERTLGRGRPASGASTTRTTAGFGSRASSAKAAAGAKPAAGATAGSLISEEARFVRGNRTASDFVGAGTGETRRFVGSEQAGGEADRNPLGDRQFAGRGGAGRESDGRRSQTASSADECPAAENRLRVRPSSRRRKSAIGWRIVCRRRRLGLGPAGSRCRWQATWRFSAVRLPPHGIVSWPSCWWVLNLGLQR